MMVVRSAHKKEKRGLNKRDTYPSIKLKSIYFFVTYNIFN